MIYKLLFGTLIDFYDEKMLQSYSVYMLFMIAFAFGSTFLSLKYFKKMLPKDQGREFAVNGDLSQGKARGCGLIFITTFCLTAALFMPLDVEYIIYLVLIYGAMITGYLDDRSETPWGNLKKGLCDLVISLGVALDYWYFNDSYVQLPLLHMSFHMPAVVFIILAGVLVWTSINVTNCTDGVDGLCTALVMTVLMTFILMRGVITMTCGRTFIDFTPVMMLAVLAAYLWFNCSPSTMLMGDAGSRSLGVLLAVLFLMSGDPFGYIPMCIVIILDGGLSLLKVSFIRFLHMDNFMKGIRTPLHDHARKNMGWSDTQVVMRFTIIQLMFDICYLAITNYDKILSLN
ncbi:MAG: phospho-N-acetylmuramoyl-pentapeptide-transferase [Ruminococcus sp.]|nr:phospho-N-acetylmuramoyl-pentapeptide-transferase [Ruminococcus sp.]MBP3798961.1 phospho-N-acetylmuramoyl-pentapeptide-transferase [Ruminococcus sp.]